MLGKDEAKSGEVEAGEAPMHDQAFFLALSAQHKAFWNKCLRDTANEGVTFTFAAIDFSAAPHNKISFEGYEFGETRIFLVAACAEPRRGVPSRPI